MLYHVFVAVRNKPAYGKKSRSSQLTAAFWLVFIVVIAGIFLVNRDTINKNFNLFKSRLSGASGIENNLTQVDLEEEIDEPAPVVNPVQKPAEKEPAVKDTASEKPKQTPSSEKPASQTTQNEKPKEKPSEQPSAKPTEQTKPAETRDRNIYFTQVDKDGQILRSRVTRKIPASETPMQDVLNVMLLGPNANELGRGIINFIPPNTRILSSIVRGSTAYINFSEDFQINTFGVEGYAAQLRQIVWTVTEFPNVNEVQILIEGRRLDYLGEGIWIGSPINRQSF